MSSSAAQVPTPDHDPAPRADLHLVSDARSRSRLSIALLLRSLSYPDDWAEELERRQFAAGKLWQLEPCDPSAG